ncbi:MULTISPECIES: ankyrin repeat domain-containing protein [unclassified Wolbachia]|uniref:ankyrin repeat domain-containing protein n=1 Tax=unclassified Wolbachia TaxID=2640676 RepID=UPI0021F89E3C|nr:MULTISPECIES: ankyrin repeat domain-containing protein [unclassified Wolbachia]
MQKRIRIENFIDELFVAIEEHSLLKANICIKTAVMMKLKNQVFIGERYGMKPISFAVKENSFKTLKFLVNNGANVNAASSESLRVALHVAAEYGREDAGQYNAPICLDHFFQSDPIFKMNMLINTSTHI